MGHCADARWFIEPSFGWTTPWHRTERADEKRLVVYDSMIYVAMRILPLDCLFGRYRHLQLGSCLFHGEQPNVSIFLELFSNPAAPGFLIEKVEMSTIDRQRISAYKNWYLAPVLVFALIIHHYVYVGVLGESDLQRVVLAILYGARHGFDKTRDFHLGLSYSYGYYWFIYNVVPNYIYQYSATLIPFINISGYVSSLLFLIAGGMLISRIYSPLAALVGLTLFGFSPMFMELSTSGHQILPAAALLLIGGNLLLAAERSGHPVQRVSLSVIAAMLIFFSLSVRAETALALPWLVVAGFGWRLDRNRVMRMLWRAMVAAIAFALFLYFQQNFLSERTSSLGAIHNYLAAYARMLGITKGLVFCVIGFGILSSAFAAIIFFTKISIFKNYFFDSLFLILPSLFLWLPNPQPSRHFYFAYFGMAILMGNALPAFFKKEWQAIAAAAAITIGNFLVIEAIYPTVVSHYEWSYANHGERRSTFNIPLGFFSRNHNANEKMFRNFKEEARAIARLDDPEIVIFGDELHYILIALLESNPNTTIHVLNGKKEEFEVYRGAQKFHLLAKSVNWPNDTVATYISANGMQSKKLYIQPYTISKYDSYR